jgi:hypothetical protein
VIPGDAKAVVLVDLNGDAWSDLLIAVNGGEMQAYETVPPVGGKVLTVDLQAAEALKVGTLLTVELTSGKQLSSEVYAGGSYLSQSSPIVRFAIPDGENASGLTVRWSDGKVTKKQLGAEQLKVKINR